MYTVTLTTDFGDSIFPPIIEAVLLKINPNLKIIVISHKINKFNIKQAKFFLENTYHYFPKNTIHLCVVDPEVGSDRKGLIVETEKYFFVGPDNGVFSFLDKKKIKNLFEITYYPSNCSYTFHGRDIFAPVAGWISLGEKIDNYARKISFEECATFSKIEIKTNREVIYIDDFGNIFLDLKYEDFKKIVGDKKFTLIYKNKVFNKINKFYSEVKKGELLLLVNSLGYLEIAVREGNAQKLLNSKIGDRYEIKINES